jgi:hypothetical protein
MNTARLLVTLIIGLAVFKVGVTGDESAIGYTNVQEAYDALESNPSAKQTEYEGWSIFNIKQDGKYILWSFTPEDHSAHPSAIRREVVSKDGEVFISMSALCHSDQVSCDRLIDEFKVINENIKARMRGG